MGTGQCGLCHWGSASAMEGQRLLRRTSLRAPGARGARRAWTRCGTRGGATLRGRVWAHPRGDHGTRWLSLLQHQQPGRTWPPLFGGRLDTAHRPWAVRDSVHQSSRAVHALAARPEGRVRVARQVGGASSSSPTFHPCGDLGPRTTASSSPRRAEATALRVQSPSFGG